MTVTEIVTVPNQKHEITANASQDRLEVFVGDSEKFEVKLWPLLGLQNLDPGSNPGGASNFNYARSLGRQ